MATDKTDLPKRQGVSRWNIVTFFLSILFVLLIWFFWMTWGIGLAYRKVISGIQQKDVDASNYLASLGQVGDLFGGVNALFASLACVGVFWAGYIQYRALSEARTAYAEEKKAIARQQFEGTFFQMLALTREIVSTIKVRRFLSKTTSDSKYKIKKKVEIERHGSRALESYGQQMVAFISKQKLERGLTPAELLIAASENFDSKIYGANPSSLGPYFRSLFQLFTLINEANFLTPEEKIFFSKIARGQLSEGAVVLLAMNGISMRGREFIPLIESYGLLEHMHLKYLPIIRPVLDLAYQPHAFLGSKKRAVTERTNPPKELSLITENFDPELTDEEDS